MSPATEQQGPAQCIGRFVRNVSSQDQLFELFAIVVEFFLIELVLQELRDHFCFSNVP